MTLPGPQDDPTFLAALAQRIGTRVVVFVPTRRRPKSLWVAPEGPAEEVERLAGLGRAWLGCAQGEDGAPASTLALVEDPSVAVATTHTTRSGLIGALVVAKRVDDVWTDAELALLRFAADYYATALEGCAGRPRPESILHPGAGTRAEFAGGIRSAAGNGEMFLVYQPEVDLETSQIVAVEALVRWRHPDRGDLIPQDFIALAENTGLIKVLGAWIVAESLREFACWLEALPDLDVTLRINVSPVQMADASLVGMIANALAERGVAGSRLCVELTENFPLEEVSSVIASLTGLKELGVTSALDDFASGFSSLGRLRALPIDAVKLDRSIVAGIDDDARGRAIVAAVLGLAGELGLDVIAEGVERPEEAAALRQLGCRRAQGHHYGRPVDAASMHRLLAGNGRKITS